MVFGSLKERLLNLFNNSCIAFSTFILGITFDEFQLILSFSIYINMPT